MVKEALAFAKLGFAVFPLAPNTKMPTKGSSGWKDATQDPDSIKRLFETKGKPYNLGISLGQASGGVVGVDLDRNHGATDEDLKRFPRTVTVKTRNGFHLYFKTTRTCKKGALWGGKNEGDNTAPAYLRADGQYLVGPYSVVTWDADKQVHLAPHEYSYWADAGGELSFEECQLADLPEWAYRDGGAVGGALQDSGNANSSSTDNNQGSMAGPQGHATTVNGSGQPHVGTSQPAATTYEPGLRHDCFVRTAVSMRKRGKGIEEIYRVLIERNQTDFTIPKANAEDEIKKICAWVEKEVKPLLVFNLNDITAKYSKYLMPLGHRDENYYYTTSDNKMIVRLGRASHTSANLLDLMPLDYWTDCYPKKDKNGEIVGVNWLQAASELMEACRFTGIYSDQNVRGVGCWEDQGRLVYHTGSELIVDGQHVSLNGVAGTNYLYTLRPSVAKAPAGRPLSVDECSTLLQACQAITWKHEQSAMLFSGALALSRLCGALSWRPHVWITSPAGCGKSSVLEYVANPILGDGGIIVQGETTSAGIRQALESDSKPILFDEAETNNERSSKRMQHILELARQASFENDGKILKGTADGSGHSYKITSMFLLASIRVNLIEEADISRFAVLELGIPDPSAWPEVKRKLTALNKDYGDRLHSRMMRLWPVLKQNILLMEDQIARLHDRRTGQQYGTLIAGWYALSHDGVMTAQEADYFASELKLENTKTETATADERDCLDWLLSHQVKYELRDCRVTETFGKLINKAAGGDQELCDVLILHGMDVTAETLFISTQNPYLQASYKDSKWGPLFHQSLARLAGCRRTKHRFNRAERRCVAIPLVTIFPK